jgi:hypothetical protein
VSREEKFAETAVSRWLFLVLTDKFICREYGFPDRFGKNTFLAANFFDGRWGFLTGLVLDLCWYWLDHIQINSPLSVMPSPLMPLPVVALPALVERVPCGNVTPHL